MKSPCRHGFTLIEVLIGTALLGMMMLILTGSLRVGAESWDKGEKRLEEANRLFTVESFLAKHVAGLLPLSGVNRRGEMEPAVLGNVHSLTYIAALPDQLQGGGIFKFNYYLQEKNGNLALRVAIVPYISNPVREMDDLPALDDIVVVDQLRDFKISYYGRVSRAGNPYATQDDPLKWTNVWRDYQFPQLIRMEITREGEDPWPPLMIAPRTQMLR